MTNNAQADLSALAARVEASTGADREIDLAIHNSLGGRTYRWAEFGGAFENNEIVVEVLPDWADDPWLYKADILRLPAYTASLDAAVKLAPRGWFKLEPDSLRGWRALGLTGPWSHAATPALALAAACLRALDDSD